MTTDRDLTLAEVADQLGISRDALRKRCDRGLVAGAFKLDGKWLIPAVSLTGLTDRSTDRDIVVSRPDSHDRSVTDQAVTAAIAALVDQLAEKDRQIAQLLALLEQPRAVETDTYSETEVVSAPVETHTIGLHIDPTVQASTGWSAERPSPRPWWRRLLGR